ncbi:EI24 domain-containing protein [Micromonospora antibiotica]|uniref:EI24 domain-containing protein n=1 Tax=Micromonospora antibiotica TaxID=2807623 RepID=A0ABS3V6J8_9ACTN|nr:EI24 domain-containing protein [Micromonospora antibiotica]MBO4161205.1 EI24 domain-containing protein [Micromonospora antibiotica]
MDPQPRPIPPTAQILPPAYGFPPAYEVPSSAQLAPVVSGKQAAPAAGGPMARDGAGSTAARMAGAAGHAVGVAGYQTLRAAKAAGTGIGRYFIGVGYFFRGGRLFVTTPGLWTFVLLPLALTGLALLGLQEAVGLLVDRLTGLLLGITSGWPEVVRWIVDKVLWVAVSLFFHGAMTALTVPLTMLFGAAFFPALTRDVIRRTGGTSRGAPPWYRSAAVCLRQTFIVTLVLHVGWLIILPLLWIPGVNLVAAFGGGLLFNGFLIGSLVLAVPLHHHGMRGVGEQMRFAWRNLGFTLGFGMTSICFLILPVLSLRMLTLLPISPVFAVPGVALYLLTAPSTLVGAVLLHQRIESAGNAGAARDVGSAGSVWASGNGWSTEPSALPAANPASQP